MRKQDAGFSLIEALVVASVAMVTVGIAAPSITAAIDTYKFNSDVQNVAATIRAARLQAVSANVTLRVRFNCPTAGKMRVVEVTGDATIDNSTSRCSLTAYPYPAPDADVTTKPNHDGPVVEMGSTIHFPDATRSLQISTAGRMVPLTGCPTCSTAAPPTTLRVQDYNTDTARTITVSATGGITLSRNPTEIGN
jgi:Tfp pilus assembly protein FimT